MTLISSSKASALVNDLSTLLIQQFRTIEGLEDGILPGELDPRLWRVVSFNALSDKAYGVLFADTGVPIDLDKQELLELLEASVLDP